MRVLIVSDIHGNFDNMKKVIQNDSSFDKMFILGDILSGYNRDGYNPDSLAALLNIYKDKIISVRGNCDYDTSRLEFPVDKYYISVPVDGKMFLLTHGHMYHRYNLPDVDYDVLLTGHSHVASIEESDKIYLNPGSVSLPRSGVKSYIFYDDGEFELKSVDEGKVLKKVRL